MIRLLAEHYAIIQRDYEDIYFNIHVTSSVEYGEGVQLEGTVKEKTAGPSNSPQHHVLASPYGDVTTEIGNNNVPMLVFPQPPALRSDRHIEISGESRSLGSELVAGDFRSASGRRLFRSANKILRRIPARA